MISERWVTCAAALVLSLARGPAWAEEALPAQPVAFQVPRMSHPPKIDGSIGEEEWKEASAISGVAAQNPGTHLLIVRPTTYYLGWDPGHLYVGVRTWLMPGYRPHAAGRAPHSANAGDDGAEFAMKPMGANVPAGRADSFYKFFVNTYGADGDLARVSVGQMFRNWQPHFQIATHLTPPGTGPLGGRWWEAEVAISTRDFELNGPNRAGDNWRMLLAFNQIPGWMQAAIPITSGYFDSSGFAQATLIENTPSVQVTMDGIPGPLGGIADVQFRGYNPTTKPVVLRLKAEWADSHGTLVRREETLEVGPGRHAVYVINQNFPRSMGTDTGHISIQVSEGEREIMHYITLFNEGYEPRWVKYTPPPEPFSLETTFNPARNNLQLRADTYTLEHPEMAQWLAYQITRAKSPIAHGEIKTTQYNYFTRLLQLPALKPGKYMVTAAMRLRDGTVLGPRTTSFEKLDEARVFAAWWKNKLGNTERVLPPFTPLNQKAGVVSLWGRVYHLDALGLPAGLLSQGQKVMAEPARIVVTTGGHEHRIPLNSAPTIIEAKPWRCRFKGTAVGAGLSLSVDGSVEQDGLTLLSLTYRPVGAKPVRIEGLRIEFPVAPETAECLDCMGPGGNFASISTLVLPQTRTGRLWSTLETGRGGSGMTVGSFYPDVWLGNEHAGLLWWGDSDAGWVPDDSVPAHEVIRTASEVVLRNNIIGKPFVLKAARTIRFGYNASPFRPLVKGWRMSIHSEDGTFEGPHKSRIDPKSGQKVDGWAWLNPPSLNPAEWSGLWADYKRHADAKVREEQPFSPARARNGNYVHTSVPLSGYGPNTSDTRVVDYFAPEWGQNVYSQTQRDYYAWLCSRAFAEGGLRTIYWDIFYITQFSSLQNGTGYLLPDGRIQPTFNGLNLRAEMMRIYAAMHDHALTPGSQVAHSTNCYPLVAFPWVDAILDGEWAEIRDSTPADVDWVDYYPVPRMRALSISENWGTQVSWMNLIHTTDRARYDRIMRGFFDYQHLHDTWTGQDGRVPEQSVLEWGINDPRVKYIPYWRKNGVTSSDSSILTSVWKMPGRVLLVVFNDSKQPQNARLAVNRAALGLGSRQDRAGGLTCRTLGEKGDSVAGIDASGTTLSVPDLPPHTGRTIGLRVQVQNDVNRLAGWLPASGQGALLEALLDWDALDGSAGKPLSVEGLVSAPGTEAKIRMFGEPGRVLCAVTNAGSQAGPVALHLDVDRLGLRPKLPWQEFLRVREFTPGSDAPGHEALAPTLDYYAQTLTLPAMKPNETRIVGVRRY